MPMSVLRNTPSPAKPRLAKRWLASACATFGGCVLLAVACAPSITSAEDQLGDGSTTSSTGNPADGNSANGNEADDAGAGNESAGGNNNDSNNDSGNNDSANSDSDNQGQSQAGNGNQPRTPGRPDGSANESLTIWPLTGLAVDTSPAPGDSQAANAGPQRRAAVVKIDNHKGARPQFGLNEADVVYEQVVEFGLTRLAAVFHSIDVEMVGPVRSIRTSDYDLLSNLGVPLFANSGGSQEVLAGLSAVDVINVGSHVAFSAYWRQPGRNAPHNLMTSTKLLRETAAAVRANSSATGSPPQLFAYRSQPRSESGAGNASGNASGNATASSPTPASGVDIDFGGTKVNYRWAQDAQAWWRTQNDVLHLDTQGRVVAPQNVIVQFIIYSRSETDPRFPQAELLGQGDAWVFTNGGLVQGRWERDEATQVTEFVDLAGNRIELTPGRTWVELVRVGQATIAR